MDASIGSGMSRRALLQATLAGLGAAALPRSLAAAEGPRVVAAGGVVTEIVYALGLGDSLMGVDTTSVYPPEALRHKPNVGYVRQLSAEGVLSLKPDLLIAVESAGPPDALRLVEQAGIRILRLSEDYTSAGIGAKIRTIGEALGRATEAQALAASVDEGFRTLSAELARITARKRVLFVLTLQNGRVTAGGKGTAADAIITLAGAVNAADAVTGYKPLTDEGIITAAPDLVLMMQRGPQSITADDLFALPAFAVTPAAKGRALVTMDGQYLLGFGPRTPAAARDLMAAIYGRGGRT